MYIVYVMVSILKFRKLDKNNLSLELTKTLKTCGLCSASSTQNTLSRETHCQADCTNSPPNLQGKHFFAERKLNALQRQLENTLRRDELSCVDVRIGGKFRCVVDSAKYDWNGVQSEISWS